MSRTRVLQGVASLAFVATLLAACGSGGQPAATADGAVPSASQAPGSASTPTPARGTALDLDGSIGLCAIFPSDRAAAALGEPVGAGSATHSTTFSNASCHYESTASDASITVWYHPGLTRDDWERSMAKIGMTAEMSVPGIGQAAYRQDRKTANPRVKLAAFEDDHDVWVIIAKTADISVLAATAEQEARVLLVAVAGGEE